MSAAASIRRPADMSPKVKGRLVGVLLLTTIVAGIFTKGLLAGSLMIAGDAAATANNIVEHESLVRLAFAIYLIEMSCQIAMTVLFYDLLKPVSKSASLLAATFGLIGCTIKILSRLFFIAPLLLLGDPHYTFVFEPKHLQSAASFLATMEYQAETIAMVFFGLYAIVKGFLVFRSTFLPRTLGVLGIVGGMGWMLYLYEPLAIRLESYIVGTAVIGSLLTVFWLLVKGVDEEHWKEQANAASASIWR